MAIQASLLLFFLIPKSQLNGLRQYNLCLEILPQIAFWAELNTVVCIQSEHWRQVLVWGEWALLVQMYTEVHPFFEFTFVEILADISSRDNFRTSQEFSNLNVVKCHVASVGP